MRVQNIFTLNQGLHASTSRLAKFLFITFFVFLPMLIFWILWSQFNVLHDNWLVGYGGNFALGSFQDRLNSFAPMKPTSEIKEWPIFAKWTNNWGNFFENVTNPNAAKDILNQAAQSVRMSAWGVGIISNWKIFVIMVADLLISILLLQLGIIFTKWFFYDAYPMVVAVWVAMFILNVCGLLDYSNWWSYLVVIISLVTSLLLFLFVMVQFVNMLLSRTKLGEYYYEELIHSNRIEKANNQNSYLENYKKQKANKSKTITFEKDDK